MNIEEVISNNQGGTVLFLGRINNFTEEELTNFLDAQGMNYADKYIGQEVALTLRLSMLSSNPNLSPERIEEFALDLELIQLMTKNETYLVSVNSAHVGMRSDDSYY